VKEVVGLIVRKLGEAYTIFLDSEYKYESMTIVDNGDGTFEVVFYMQGRPIRIWEDYYDNYGVTDIKGLIEKLKNSPKFYQMFTGKRVKDFDYVAEEEIDG